MNLGLADDYTALALHALAHVPRTSPANLADGWYLDWSARMFSPDVARQALDDGALLAAMPGLDGLDLLPQLHRSLAAYRRTAARSLADVAPHEVADPAVLRALQRLGPLAELAHTTLALIAPAFARVHAAHIEPWGRAAIPLVSPWLAALAEHAPGLADARIELAWPLGQHGRAMPDRILVGCTDLTRDPPRSAILAMHEHAVLTSQHADHDRAEWDALRRAARWSASAAPPLRQAHAAWLAHLDLRSLVARLEHAGHLDPAAARHLLTAPNRRADDLRAL